MILLQPQREWVCCYKWKQNNSKTYQTTNILRMYLLNCCFGLNKNDDFDNYESTISGEPYMWRNQDDHWDVITLDFNLCGTAPWTDIHHQLFIYLFYLFYLNHYLSHWWLIVTFVTKNNGNNFLTLEQLHTFLKLFFSNCDFILQYCSLWIYQSSKEVTSQRSQTSINSLGLVKICDGLVKFKHGYRATRILN